jgi:photosynthetic reaction center cytochrome c subunit
MIRRDVPLSTAALATALLVASAAGAQQPPAGQPQAPAHQNLKVLPMDIPQAQLLQIMQNFTQALGVQCVYCHVTTPQGAAPATGAAPGARGGRGAPPPFDFPSDEKPQKRAAREMLLLVRDINPRVASAVGKSADAATRVGCVTCHRGVAIPKQLADILDQTTTDKGLPAAVAQYKELRTQYFGAQAYDFSEASLGAYAQRIAQANKLDDAIAWLQLNLENFPMSSRTYLGLSQVQQRKGDKDAAVRSLEKAVEFDPQNAQLKRQLDQLKGQ